MILVHISQISAEMLLNYFYPELREKWVARYAGTFYRNYNNDHLSVFEESAEVVLARDGFLKLLPEALLSDENELRGGHALEKSQQLEKKKKLFQEAFMPFNTFSFRQKMNMEQKLSEILRNKLDYLLKTFFHYDLAAETNPYIKKIAVLLPYVSKFRADFGSVARMLGLLFGCKTQLKVGRYSCKDSTRYWIPNVEYQLLMPLIFNNANVETARMMPTIQKRAVIFASWCGGTGLANRTGPGTWLLS